MTNHSGVHTLYAGLALGFTFALMMVLLGLVAWLTGFGTELVTTVGGFYHGYTPTLVGSLIGGVWAMAEGFVIGFVVSWIYNFLCARTTK